MSPEQVKRKPADARSDIFSFGVILYEMLVGRRAFQGDSAVEGVDGGSISMLSVQVGQPPTAERERSAPS